MKKSLIVIVGLLFAGAALSAQDLSKAKVKNDREQITFDTDVKVGATVLKAGEYLVIANGTQLTFRHLVENSNGFGHYDIDMKMKPVVVVCPDAVVRPEKSESTEMDMPTDASGVKVLKRLTLVGSDVEYTISK